MDWLDNKFLVLTTLCSASVILVFSSFDSRVDSTPGYVLLILGGFFWMIAWLNGELS